jgi:phosphoribosylformylglycinamidine synthase
MDAVLNLIDQDLVNCVHDCSKGGIAIAVSELCINNQVGCVVSLKEIPGQKLKPDEILFSESHSRYVLAVNPKNIKKVKDLLDQKDVQYGIVGKFSGSSIVVNNKTKKIIDLRIDKAQEKWLNSLESLIAHG